MTPRRQSETPLMHEIRAALTATGHIALWRNNTGFDADRKIKYGLGLGGADLVGILKPSGRFVGVEIKTATGRTSPDQMAWASAVRAAGGLYILTRTPEDAIEQLTQALR